MLKKFKNILISTTALCGLLGGAVSATYTPPNKPAQAYLLDYDKIQIVKDISPFGNGGGGVHEGLKINPFVPQDSVGANIHWNINDRKSQILEAGTPSGPQETIGDATLNKSSIIGSFSTVCNIHSGNDIEKDQAYYKW